MSVVSYGDGLEQLRQAIAAEGGELAAGLVPARSGATFGPLAVAGPRTQADPRAYSLLMESIFEGYLLHHWEGRILELPDSDLRLLCGDYLYAFGLSRLAELEDPEAVAELADLISLCAAVHAGLGSAAADPGAESLPAALWALGALAVAAGPWPGHAQVKAAVRAGSAQALQRALAQVAARGRETGLEEDAGRALIAFQETISSPFGTM